jgi:hypothetical protein
MPAPQNKKGCPVGSLLLNSLECGFLVLVPHLPQCPNAEWIRNPNNQDKNQKAN